MTLVFRDARHDDLPRIDSLYRESFCATFAHLYAADDLAAFLAQFTPATWDAEFADPAYAFHVADAGEALAGYCKMGPPGLPCQQPEGSIELRQLYVGTAWHGVGVAPRLMDWALERARAVQAPHVFLSVYIDNHRARRFYDRYGFMPVGPYKFMVGNHADEDIIMKLDL